VGGGPIAASEIPGDHDEDLKAAQACVASMAGPAAKATRTPTPENEKVTVCCVFSQQSVNDADGSHDNN